MNISDMNQDQLLSLQPDDVQHQLTAPEVLHMAAVLGAMWTYDYGAADAGRVGMHALLKSGRHSDGFFVSKILLEPPNIRQVIVNQMVLNIIDAGITEPKLITGVPDSATLLGEEIVKAFSARIQGVELVQLRKEGGNIVLETPLPAGKPLLLVEDVCTRGTGFIEAVHAIRRVSPSVNFLPLDPVILNRGGLAAIVVEEVGTFKIAPVFQTQINDWEADACPLCARGSTAIKPKLTPENWQQLINSQKV